MVDLWGKSPEKRPILHSTSPDWLAVLTNGKRPQ